MIPGCEGKRFYLSIESDDLWLKCTFPGREDKNSPSPALPLRGREAVRPMMFGGKGGAVVQA